MPSDAATGEPDTGSLDSSGSEHGRAAGANRRFSSSARKLLRGPDLEAKAVRMIDVGEQAPDFTLPDQEGDEVSLSGLAGRTVVLYFYPKADTPGCTTQACGIRDHQAEYDAAGVTVLGVSPDTVEDVRKFHEKQSLNFRLLADADHSVAERYGTWQEKTNYGKTYWGVTRSTFIIDGEGVVRHVIPKASPKTHDDVVLKVLGELQAA